MIDLDRYQKRYHYPEEAARVFAELQPFVQAFAASYASLDNGSDNEWPVVKIRRHLDQSNLSDHWRSVLGLDSLSEGRLLERVEEARRQMKSEEEYTAPMQKFLDALEMSARMGEAFDRFIKTKGDDKSAYAIFIAEMIKAGFSDEMAAEVADHTPYENFRDAEEARVELKDRLRQVKIAAAPRLATTIGEYLYSESRTISEDSIRKSLSGFVELARAIANDEPSPDLSDEIAEILMSGGGRCLLADGKLVNLLGRLRQEMKEGDLQTNIDARLTIIKAFSRHLSGEHVEPVMRWLEEINPGTMNRHLELTRGSAQGCAAQR